MRIHNNIKEFFHAHDGHIFRFWVYKKMFTPYEQDNKFLDESIYENEHCYYGRIVDVVTLPDNDILIAFQIDENYLEGKKDINYVSYYKLSEIHLDWCIDDQTEENKKPLRERILEIYGININEEDI